MIGGFCVGVPLMSPEGIVNIAHFIFFLNFHIYLNRFLFSSYEVTFF